MGVIGFSSVEKNNHLNLLIHLLSVFEPKYGSRPMLDIGDKIQFLSSKTPQITQNDMYVKTVLAGRLKEGSCAGHFSSATSKRLGSPVRPASSE